MCEKTWGEEFRDALALASGSSALDECAALNVSRVVELAQQCLPHCPPIDGHKEPGDRPLDATDMHADMLPALITVPSVTAVAGTSKAPWQQQAL